MVFIESRPVLARTNESHLDRKLFKAEFFESSVILTSGGYSYSVHFSFGGKRSNWKDTSDESFIIRAY